jgi:hypothetical protein
MKLTRRRCALLAAVSLGAMFAGSASAALKKYDVVYRNQTNNPQVTPNPNVTIPRANFQEFSSAVVGNTGGPNPTLRKLVRAQDQTTTTFVTSLTATVFVSVQFREGPDVPNQIRGNPVATFTGTGNTAAGTTTRWGTVTGWTLSGSIWCNSEPIAVVCSLASLMDEETLDGRFNSNAYDLGTW